MTTIEEEIEEYIENLKGCPNCGHTKLTAHIEDDAGYSINLKKHTYCKVSANGSVYNPCQYIIITCNKCDKKIVDDIFSQ